MRTETKSGRMRVYKHNTIGLFNHSHVQRISSRVGAWGSDHSLISPSRNVLHLRAVHEFVTSHGASPTSNAGAHLAPDDSVFHVTAMLRDRVSTRETTTDSTGGASNRARSAAAARWGKLACRVVVPSRSGFVFHLSGKLGQDVGWQLSVSVGLGDIVAKLGWVVVIVDHGWVLVRDRGLVVSNDRAASGDVVRWYNV
jgi:hypothetical protein